MTTTREDIVLIGPVAAGKSTVAKLLAQQLGLPQVSMDVTRWHYYREIGYDSVFADQVRQHGGFLALALYWSIFDAYAIEQTLLAHPHSVFDFGAGVYESKESFARVQAALANFPNVVLLLPVPDATRSLKILGERDKRRPHDLDFDLNGHFLRHPSYAKLAKKTVFTHGQTPQQTCTEVLRQVGF